MLSVRTSFALDAADCGRCPRRHCPLFVLSLETFSSSSASVGLINLSATGFLQAPRCCCSSHRSWKDTWWSSTPVHLSVFSVTSRPLPFGAAPDLWSLDMSSPAERGALTGDKRMLSDLSCGCLPTGGGSDEEAVVWFNHHDRKQLFCGYSQKIRKDPNYCLHGNSPAVRFM